MWVSTTDQQLSGFTHLVGYFRVHSPAGSWHKYGFSLSPFDSSDIYFAVNYQYEWHVDQFASGIYVYRLEAGSFKQRRKMLLVR